MKDIVNVGFVGIGRRGQGELALLLRMKDVHVKTICDLRESSIKAGLELFEKAGKPKPQVTYDYHDILKDPEIDAVINITGWNMHVKISLDSVLAGKYTAVEVGCAYDLEECYQLVNAYEQTGAPLMMLENCCYDRREMMLLNMIKQGLFGEIIHCEGAYSHQLSKGELVNVNEETGEVDNSHYRLPEYLNRNCEEYPTHELGPICKILNINRGNRLMTISSFASKSRGLKEHIVNNVDPSQPLYHAEVHQGDIITSVITCANGETILLELDTTLPIPGYSRKFCIRGTRGMSSEERQVVYLDTMKRPARNNEKEFYEKYDHPLHREYMTMPEEKRNELNSHGHGIMDWLVVRGFIDSVKRGVNTPIDAYDTATLMSIAPLSEMSIARGGAPVNIPDFTRGKWFRREELVHGKYCLGEIKEYPDQPIFMEGEL